MKWLLKRIWLLREVAREGRKVLDLKSDTGFASIWFHHPTVVWYNPSESLHLTEPQFPLLQDVESNICSQNHCMGKALETQWYTKVRYIFIVSLWA